MELPRQLSVLLERRHEAAERHDAAVREQLPNLISNINNQIFLTLSSVCS